jgi:ferritin-like metal-binding protein YciE
MEGLAMEGEAMINTTAPGSAARTRGLIMACQKVEQYEMSTYNGLSLLATQLGETEVAGLLKQTMAEEAAANQALATISEKQ